MAAAGTYASESDMTTAFGSDLIARWSSRDAASTSIDSDVVQQAIDWAEQEIHDLFQDGPYAIPFAFTSAAAKRTVTRWVVTLAAQRLHLPRSMQPGTRPQSGGKSQREKVADAADAVRREMLNYTHGGGPRLGAAKGETEGGNAPTVV